MIRNKQIVSFIVLFLLLINLVASQEKDEFDYGNPDFIRNSDPAKWDKNKVDFSNLEYQVRINSDEKARKWYQDNYCSGACTISPQSQQLTYSNNGIKHPNGDFVSVD